MTVFTVPAKILGFIILFAVIIGAVILLALGALSAKGDSGREMREAAEKDAEKEEERHHKQASSNNDEA